MSDCRHIATCPTSSSNGVNEKRTTRRGNRMRERAEGRDDNGTDSPRWQARREAGSQTGRDDAGKEFSPTCLLAYLLTCQLAHYTYYAFSRPFRPVLIVFSSRRAIREAGRFFSHPLSSRSSGPYSIMLRAVFASSFLPSSRRAVSFCVSSGLSPVCCFIHHGGIGTRYGRMRNGFLFNVIFFYLTSRMLNMKK